ncbi:serine protease 40 [Desmodus rotundus]|uniref:serine protease 40 n=1 Tax=Desmodus rotundus TaxID=9430 RepID=UPI00238101C6|nr:serine protease 40 [Desmodus rotundus]
MGLGDRHGSHTWPEAAVRALAFILPAAGSQTGRGCGAVSLSPADWAAGRDRSLEVSRCPALVRAPRSQLLAALCGFPGRVAFLDLPRTPASAPARAGPPPYPAPDPLEAVSQLTPRGRPAMETAGARGAGPGRRAALTLAMFLLWLWPPLRAQPSGTTATTATTPNTAAVCGRPVVAGKILGGSNAPDQRWPWQASLHFRGRHICGAALVDTFWVVSAAHCFQKSHDPRDYLVLLGYHTLHKAGPHSLQVAVSQVIVHSGFNRGHFMGNDVALLQLRQAVAFTSHVLPACLPGPNTTLPAHAACWITGWGMLTESDFLPRPFQLQEGQVSLLESRICRVFFQAPDPSGQKYNIDEGVLCAGTMSDGTSICRGDSGGPLSCQLNNTWFVMGLSSWSLPCHRPVNPSVFTRLTHFSRWIREKQRATPPPTASPHRPATTNGPSSAGAFPRPGFRTAWLLSQALPLLLLLSLLGVP